MSYMLKLRSLLCFITIATPLAGQVPVLEVSGGSVPGEVSLKLFGGERGTIAAINSLGYEIINLGSDKPVVVNRAIQIVENLIKKKARVIYLPRHPADVLATWADISKAKKLLKWKPKTNLEAGLENLVSWYQENRSWAREIETEQTPHNQLKNHAYRELAASSGR